MNNKKNKTKQKKEKRKENWKYHSVLLDYLKPFFARTHGVRVDSKGIANGPRQEEHGCFVVAYLLGVLVS